jgi:hypothetical protein
MFQYCIPSICMRLNSTCRNVCFNVYMRIQSHGRAYSATVLCLQAFWNVWSIQCSYDECVYFAVSVRWHANSVNVWQIVGFNVLLFYLTPDQMAKWDDTDDKQNLNNCLQGLYQNYPFLYEHQQMFLLFHNDLKEPGYLSGIALG